MAVHNQNFADSNPTYNSVLTSGDGENGRTNEWTNKWKIV